MIIDQSSSPRRGIDHPLCFFFSSPFAHSNVLSTFPLPIPCSPTVPVPPIPVFLHSFFFVRIFHFSGSLLCSILVIGGIVREELVGGERRRTFAFGEPAASRGLHIQTESVSFPSPLFFCK